jgi:hypothetical protein
MRADKEATFAHLRRALDLFAELPDSEAKAEAWLEWARLHFLDFARDDAVLAAATAAGIARRLGLLEVQANAMVTAASVRYFTGEAAGLPALEEAVEFCRRHRLPALVRGTRNLSVVLQEEGDLRRSRQLQSESDAAQGGRRVLVSNSSEPAEQAFFDGDWPAMLHAAREFLDGQVDETAVWDLQLPALRSWIQVLRGEDPCDAVLKTLEHARKSGFRRLLRCAVAHGALCRVLQGERDEATELLRELEENWRAEPVWPSREWLAAAAHAAALLGGEGAAAMRRVLDSVGHQTLWTTAATHLLDGSDAAHRGEYAVAARHYMRAVAVYDEMGNESDAGLTAAWTFRALVDAGDDEAARAWRDRVRNFVRRNGAHHLLDEAHSLPVREGDSYQGKGAPQEDRVIVLEEESGEKVTVIAPGRPPSTRSPAD